MMRLTSLSELMSGMISNFKTTGWYWTVEVTLLRELVPTAPTVL